LLHSLLHLINSEEKKVDFDIIFKIVYQIELKR